VIVKLVNHAAKGITNEGFELAHKIEEVIMWQPGKEGWRIGKARRRSPFKYSNMIKTQSQVALSGYAAVGCLVMIHSLLHCIRATQLMSYGSRKPFPLVDPSEAEMNEDTLEYGSSRRISFKKVGDYIASVIHRTMRY